MQQINLYRFMPHPIRSPLTIKVLLLLFGLFCLFLMAIYFVALENKHKKIARLAQLTVEISTVREQIITLAEQYPQLHLKSQVIPAEEACKDIFSEYLTGLANITVSSVWLTEFTIAANGKQLRLQGHALQAKQIEDYINQLNQSNVFAGLFFKLEQVTEGTPDLKSNVSLLNFSLVSEASSEHI